MSFKFENISDFFFLFLDSSLPNSTEEENRVESKYDSSESFADSYLNNEPEYANQEKPRQLPSSNPNINTNTINQSPYYYADLLSGAKHAASTNTQRSLKASTTYSCSSTAPKKYRSFLDDPPSPPEVILSPAQYKKRNQNQQKRHSISEPNRCDTFSSTTSDDSNCSECQKRRAIRNLPPSRDDSFIASVDFDRDEVEIDEDEEEEEVPSPAPNEFPCNCYNQEALTEDEISSMAPNRLLGHATCICSNDTNNDENGSQYRSKSIFYVHQQGEDQCADCTINKVNDENYQYEGESMSNSKRRVQVYETAFDSSVQMSGSDENCEIEERIRNIMLIDPKFIRKNEQENKFNCDYHNNRQISESRNVSLASYNSSSSKNLSTTKARYSNPQTPPSTAPMPIKFPEQHEQMHFRDNMQSAPNLPQSNLAPHHSNNEQSSERNKNHGKKSMAKKKCSHATERVKQVRKNKRKQQQHTHRVASTEAGAQKYSSTESLSSSDGSIESIHSSVSDGNRSSISSGSRNSASLSSHSSDSGARVRYPLRAPVIVHSILSPISDKSIQESSEMFAGSSRKNLQIFNDTNPAVASATNKEFTKQTSVDMMLLENQKQNKRRYLQNRTSLLLKDEIQGSDSGISLQSRDDTKAKNLILSNANGNQQQDIALSLANQSQTSNQGFNNSGLSLPEDFSNLPFDMPKLRRNLLSEQVRLAFIILCRSVR